jgi:hypothetical protein
MILKDSHAKAQSRKEIQMSKAQPFFAPLRLCVSICLLSLAFSAMAETTNDLSDAEIQGRNLAQQLYYARPETNFIQNGTLNIRNKNGIQINIPIKCTTLFPTTIDFHVILTNWSNLYEASLPQGDVEQLQIYHANNSSNNYTHHVGYTDASHSIWGPNMHLPVAESTPFANSDFWVADLGLEFFDWPEQKILKRENSRGRVCKVLESTNPNPSTNGYSRVDSWIDEETLGIVQAYAYDAQGKKLKEFYPKDFKKVDGQWQVGMMEMDNVQTGSRSRIEFDLK